MLALKDRVERCDQCSGIASAIMTRSSLIAALTFNFRPPLILEFPGEHNRSYSLAATRLG